MGKIDILNSKGITYDVALRELLIVKTNLDTSLTNSLAKFINDEGIRILKLDTITFSLNKYLHAEETFLKILSSCISLEVIWLENMGINTVPKSILNFKRLIDLSLKNNPLENEIAIISHLAYLRKLNLENCRQITIPDLKNIEILNISNNPLGHSIGWNNGFAPILNLKDSLTELHINYCNFEEVPQEILQLEKLKNLYLKGNNIKPYSTTLTKLQEKNIEVFL